MKKYTVEIHTTIYATFHDVEAESEDAAKEAAMDMFFDDPIQYVEFDKASEMDAWEEETPS